MRGSDVPVLAGNVGVMSLNLSLEVGQYRCDRQAYQGKRARLGLYLLLFNATTIRSDEPKRE